MDRRKLDEAFEFIQGSTKNGGLLVVRNGWLVYENYFGLGHREATPNLASCGKSFTSIAVGILLAERPELFPDGLDQKVFTPDYFPAEAFPLSDPRKKEIKLGQLLAFTAGIRGNNPSYVNGKETTIDPVGPDGWQSMVEAFALRQAGRQAGQDDAFQHGHALVRSGRRLLVRLRPPSIWRRSCSGTSRAWSCKPTSTEASGQAAGLGPLGLRLQAGPRSDAHSGRRRHRAAGDRHAAVRLSAAARRPLERHAARARRIRPPLRRTSPYNPHYPYSLQFNVNTDGDDPGASAGRLLEERLRRPRALRRAVAGPGGLEARRRDEQYSPSNTGLPPSPAAAGTNRRAKEAGRKPWTRRPPCIRRSRG